MADKQTDTPKSIRVRTIDASSIADLIRIAEETGLSPWSPDDLIAEIKNPNAVVMKAISDTNEFLGFVVGRLVPGGEGKCASDAEIYNIAIAGSYQQKGLGQRLFDEFLSV